MEFGISVQIDWDLYKSKAKDVAPRIAKVRGEFRKHFPGSKLDGFNSLKLRASDENLVGEIIQWMDGNCMRWLDPETEFYRVVVLDLLTIDEMARARWLPLHYTADTVDSGDDLVPFNKYPVILCQTCGRFDETVLPSPFRISRKTMRSKEEVFPGRGLLFVNQRVRKLLTDLVGNEIEFGDTSFVDSSGRVVASEKTHPAFLWVRPKHVIGANVREKPQSPCPQCGVARAGGPREDTQAKLQRGGETVEHFGKRNLNIACIHTLIPPTDSIVLSGGLWALLYNSGVKGLILPEECIRSAKGEPPIEPERRFANLKTGKDDKFLKLKMWWQKEKV